MPAPRGYYVAQLKPDADYPDRLTRLHAIEIRVADGGDAPTWTAHTTPIAFGHVPGVVEASHGTLFLSQFAASHGGASSGATWNR
jgi:hypothetical protein